MPRHVFLPCWWAVPDGATWGTWQARTGADDKTAWMAAAYRDASLVTEIDRQHADHARPGEILSGTPTSSSAMPRLVMRMLRHGQVYAGDDLLLIATGSGYSTALAAQLLGDDHLTSVDVGPYLTAAAAARLAAIGLHPPVLCADGTGPLPGTYDRIVSMTAVRPIPPTWLAALRPGGRLVTVISGTSLLLTATASGDGGTEGRIEWERITFMPALPGDALPPDQQALIAAIGDQDGEEITRGRYPLGRVAPFGEVASMLEVAVPGIAHHYEEDDGMRTAWMAHADGSWARARACGGELPLVHQAGPRRLWDLLEEVRRDWLLTGRIPLYGAKARVDPAGTIHLTQAGGTGWHGRID
ncbi:protein-L-isoaspartate(D-aspartate) O-methyltransferase [Planomonospora venezuelensis]|uniref:Protein-L-isoaspartate O-methyltransferase n=1 Tax=Planomonospora venezuelensis TaxID=1999 RepID=A0A841DI17_PLAVE|nr:protein-L-isoaspartate O-methyltransferase [Planomonospora venezuelensis]